MKSTLLAPHYPLKILITLCALLSTSLTVSTPINPPHSQTGRIEAVEVGMFLDWVLPDLDPNKSLNWKIVDAFPNLVFKNPVYALQEPGSNDLWVAEHAGKIYRFNNRKEVTAEEKTNILDISSRVKQDDASGLKSFAFHPEYGQDESPNAHYIYLFYRYTPFPPDNGDSAYLRLSRFSVQANGQINADSELVLIQQFSVSRWHDGGDILFDNEGYLYVSLGEDTQVAHAQTLNGGLFGGVIRIDVDMDTTRSHPIRRQPQNMAPSLPPGWENSFSQGYYIPNDNPWQSDGGTYLEEFYAIGLRSPHRMTYDQVNDEIWLGDVGESRREEINLITKKANYGWPIWEGSLPGDKAGNVLLNEGDIAFPVYSYTHTEGQAIIGGHVYRGATFADELTGSYIYSDYATRNVYALTLDESTGEPKVEFLAKAPAGGLISGLGKDASNELLLIQYGFYGEENGRLLRLEKTTQTVRSAPSTVSYTGAFTDFEAMTAKEALIPYSVINPLWSDGSTKKRWFAIPNNGSHDIPQEQMTFSANGNWDFPVGSVFVKHFSYKGTHIETRFLVRGEDSEWYGLSYKWREDQSDADLLEDGLITNLKIKSGETIQWQFPSRTQCFQCHTENAGVILGFRSHQLNSSTYYPSTGITANQLSTFATIGLLGDDFDVSQLDNLLTSAAIDDEEADVSFRVRSYLDSNCSHCHQPGGNAVALFDARLTTPLEEQNLIDGTVVESLVSGSRIVKPGDLNQSALYLRMNSLEAGITMPPLSRYTIDSTAIDLIREWILDPLLPVTLVRFHGISNGKTTTLQWETQSEQNNYGFEIQRRYVSTEFATIGFIEGKGTTETNHNYQFTDQMPPLHEQSIYYRLKQIDFNGQHEYSSEIRVFSPIPATAQLFDNYPEPFNPITTIGYELSRQGLVKIMLFDMLGRKVRTLVEEKQSAGSHQIVLDATDLPNGAYIYTLETMNTSIYKTLVVQK